MLERDDVVPHARPSLRCSTIIYYLSKRDHTKWIEVVDNRSCRAAALGDDDRRRHIRGISGLSHADGGYTHWVIVGGERQHGICSRTKYVLIFSYKLPKEPFNAMHYSTHTSYVFRS